MHLGFVARTCSTKGFPSICLLELVNTGSASCSMSMRGSLLNGFLLWIFVFVHLSFIWQCHIVTTENSVCSTLSFSCFCSCSCFSDGNSMFCVWKKTWSSCAMPVDTMLTSICCVGTSSPTLRIFVSFRSDSVYQQQCSFWLECVRW